MEAAEVPASRRLDQRGFLGLLRDPRLGAFGRTEDRFGVFGRAEDSETT